MSVGLKVDADVIVLCLFVEIFHSGGCEKGLHSEGLLEILGRRVVGIVGLDEANSGLCGNVQQEYFSFV